MAFEEEFSIEVPDEEAEKLQSVGDVISAIFWGKKGMGFLRLASKSPSSVSFAFNCSKAICRAPIPFGSRYSKMIW